MSKESVNNLNNSTDTGLLLQLQGMQSSALTPDALIWEAYRAGDMKEKIDRMAAEVGLRQDQMHLINDIISLINMCTDDKNGLDLRHNVGLQEKLRVAKELGVHLDEDKLEYNPVQRDRLMENLHLAINDFEMKNKNQTQRIEILMREYDRVVMALKEIQKGEKKSKDACIHGIKT